MSKPVPAYVPVTAGAVAATAVALLVGWPGRAPLTDTAAVAAAVASAVVAVLFIVGIAAAARRPARRGRAPAAPTSAVRRPVGVADAVTEPIEVVVVGAAATNAGSAGSSSSSSPSAAGAACRDGWYRRPGRHPPARRGPRNRPQRLPEADRRTGARVHPAPRGTGAGCCRPCQRVRRSRRRLAAYPCRVRRAVRPARRGRHDRARSCARALPARPARQRRLLRRADVRRRRRGLAAGRADAEGPGDRARRGATGAVADRAARQQAHPAPGRRGRAVLDDGVRPGQHRQPHPGRAEAVLARDADRRTGRRAVPRAGTHQPQGHVQRPVADARGAGVARVRRGRACPRPGTPTPS